MLMHCWRKKTVVRRVEWGRALTCWNLVTSRWAAKNGQLLVAEPHWCYAVQWECHQWRKEVCDDINTFPSISFPNTTICLLFTSPSPYTDTPIIAVHVHCSRSILSPDYRQIIDSKRTYWVYADKSKPTSHCWRRQPSIDYILHFLCCLCRRKSSVSREGTTHLFSNLLRKQVHS